MTDEATPKTIGGRIRSRRLQLGITMEELGESIGVTRQTVCRYENGIVKNIPLGVLISLTGTLGISADYLLGLTDTCTRRDDVCAVQLPRYCELTLRFYLGGE